ncbi:MAG: GNAT family N-acetyltransferase [Planctomycetes bacterium]|nr:GNAT family N-acetyltransferase [Planctomycetota bacterium]
MPLEIRDAGLPDAETIVDFNRRLARETESKELSLDELIPGVRQALQQPDQCRYLVACLDGQTVGQIMLTYEWSDWRNGRIWWIQSVYVPAEFRRLGVFRALFQHVEQLARQTPGVVGLRLYVERHNTAAHEVYRRMGLADAGYVVLEKIL